MALGELLALKRSIEMVARGKDIERNRDRTRSLSTSERLAARRSHGEISHGEKRSTVKRDFKRGATR